MQPYTLAASSLTGHAWRSVTRRASGAVVLAGIAFGALFAVVAAIVGTSSDVGRALLVVGILAPGLALQEFWRVASFAASRARAALANDACWAIGQVIAFGLLLWSGDVTVAGCVFAWGVGACLAAALGVLQLSVMPKPDVAALRWARESGRVGAWFTAVNATFTLGLLGVAVVITATTGSAGLGLFRTVQNLFGPVQLLTIGAESVFLPHLVRVIKQTRANAFEESRRYSCVMSFAVGAYGLLVLVSAHTILTRVFGTAFAAATVLVLPIMLAFLLDAAASGAALQLRAHARGGRLLVAQVAATLVRVASVAILVSVGGLAAAAWGLVIGSGVGAVAMWAQVLLTNRAPGADRSSSLMWSEA